MIFGFAARPSWSTRRSPILDTRPTSVSGLSSYLVKKETHHRSERREKRTVPFSDTHGNHDTVKHSHMESKKGDCHTNGIESFQSMMNWVDVGAFHKLSKLPLCRRVGEFAGRHYMRELGAPAQMAIATERAIGQRLRYKDLVG